MIIDASYRQRAEAAFDTVDAYRHFPGIDRSWLEKNVPLVAPAYPAADLPTLPRYEVLGEIGRGGMGTVYRARDRKLGRDVCIKALHHAACQQADRLRRFRREARLIGSLNHPNLCTLYELEEHQGLPYLVLEWVNGETLREISRNGWEATQPLRFIEQVAQALDAAHTAGVIHRDIKPENLMVRNDGLVKVLDFGLARLHAQAPKRKNDSDVLTAEGALLGTPMYMSPEQARGESTTAASDVFSLGTVLFEMLSGKNPFRKGSSIETMLRIGQQPAPSLADYVDSPPQELIAVVSAMHADRPDQRPTARDVSRRLHELLEHTDLGSMAVKKKPLSESTLQQQSTLTSAPTPQSTNLPPRKTTLTGRDAELADLTQRLDKARVVTVVGPGGVGKTSLACEAARREERRFPGGVWLCELAPLRSKDGVLEALAGVLDGNAGAVNKFEEVAARLGGEPTLLLLDNCEHVIDTAAELVDRLSQQLPNLTVLATSREALQIPPESILRLEGLGDLEAATLFVTRAAQQSDFEDDSQFGDLIKQIVQQLEGLPLAIELAAPKLGVMTPLELLEALGNQSTTLRKGRRASGRQSAIDQTIAWSFDLLQPEEQETLLALSVFTAWFTSEAAVEVAALGSETKIHLSRLVEQSVVARKEDRGRSRYRLLEPIRQFCQARIDHDKLEAARERHARYFAKRTIEKLSLGISGYDELECLHALNAEWPDLREAIAWGREHRVAEVAIEPCIALARTAYWQMRHELFEWLLAAEAVLPEAVAGDADALASINCGLWWRGQHEEAAEYLQRLSNLAPTPLSLWLHALMATNMRDYKKALGFWNRYQQLTWETGTDSEQRWTRILIGAVARVFLDPQDQRIDEDIETANRQNIKLNWQAGESICLAAKTVIEVIRGNTTEARSVGARSIETARRLGCRYIEMGVGSVLAGIEAGEGNHPAPEMLREALVACRNFLEAGNHALLPLSTRGLVTALAAVGAGETAALGAGVAEKLVGAGDENQFTPDYPNVLDQLRSELGDERFEELREEGRRLSVQDLLEIAEEVAAQHDGES